MNEQKEISFPRLKKGMWLRQHKMHVGKWHVKTFFLSVALVVAVCLYWRMQTQSATSVEGGSRARRQGLIRVHAFGAKPYKSLALTRRVLAQMRNKTTAAEKNKKKPPTKKGAVAQMSNRRSKAGSTERKNEPVNSASRKVAPPRGRSSERTEPSRRRVDQTRRVAGRVTSNNDTVPRKNTTVPGGRFRTGAPIRNRTELSRTTSSRQREFENAQRNKTALPESPTVANNINRNRNSPRPSEINLKANRRETDEKNVGTQGDEDEDDEDSSEKNDANEKVTKQKPVGASQIKSKEVINDNKDNKKSPVLSSNNSPKSDVKESSTSAKSAGPNEKEKAEKARKEKEEEKLVNKDKEISRFGLERRRAGLAEDRPKGSSKKTNFAEPKKKQNDIKLEEDRLDAEISTVKKTSAKDQAKQSTDDLNENSRKTSQKKSSPDVSELSLQTKGDNDTVAEEYFIDDKQRKTSDLKVPIKNSSTPSILQSKSHHTLAQKSVKSTPRNKINDEHFYIEGQLHFGGGGNKKGVANMRISRGEAGDSTASHKNAKQDYSEDSEIDDTASNIWNALHAVLGSQKSAEFNPTQSPDPETVQPPPSTSPPPSSFNSDEKLTSQTVLNSDDQLTSETPLNSDDQLTSQTPLNSDNKLPSLSSSSQPNTDDVLPSPSPSPLNSNNKLPSDVFRAAEDKGNTNPGLYESDSDAGYNDYDGRYDTMDVQGNEYDSDDYSDSSDYDAYNPDTDVAYYQNYGNSLKGGTLMYGDNGMIPQTVLTRGRLANDLNYGTRPNVNSFDPNKQLRIPPSARRQYGSSMTIPQNNILFPPIQGDIAGGKAVDGSFSSPDTESRQEALNADSLNNVGYDPNQGQPAIENAATSVSVTSRGTPLSTGEKQTSEAYNQLSSASPQTPTPTPIPDTPIPEAESQTEDMTSREQLQADARDSMQRYAALSAQANPGPVEIKPLAHEQRLQRVHTIPQ